jgi:hypothetical protein
MPVDINELHPFWCSVYVFIPLKNRDCKVGYPRAWKGRFVGYHYTSVLNRIYRVMEIYASGAYGKVWTCKDVIFDESINFLNNHLSSLPSVPSSIRPTAVFPNAHLMRQLLFHPFLLRRFRGVLFPPSNGPSPPLRSLSRSAYPSRRSLFREANPDLRLLHRLLPAFRGGHRISRQSQASTASVSLLLTHVRNLLFVVTSMNLMRTQTSTTSISSSTGTITDFQEEHMGQY